MTKKVICDYIEIKGVLSRREIVQKIVNTFIDTEHRDDLPPEKDTTS